MNQPNPEGGTASKDVVNPSYAARLLFQTFKFSQGDQKLQTSLFAYIHALHPTWKFTQDDFNKTYTQSQSLVNDYFLAQTKRGIVLHDLGHKKLNHEDMTTRMVATFSNQFESKTPEKETVVKNIVKEMIHSDYGYIVERDGRDRSPEGDSPSYDKYLSHLCFYGLEGNKTGFREFDVLFQEIKSEILNPEKTSEWFTETIIDEEENESLSLNGMINSVVLKYNATHPGKSVKLPVYTLKA
ncbi:MAG: hypothetical protein KA035_03630 [Candidatus Levybacteria bacterium]|nr:hypothetical protein [Candidatus Levybacteria bacterium]